MANEVSKLVYKGNKANLPATRNATSFYLCEDTRELFFGANLYTEAVRFFNATKPANPAQGVLYIDLADGAGYSWDGTAWKDVIKSVQSLKNELIGDAENDTKDSDTIEGAKRYADDVKSTLEGTASDTKDSTTIAGAKKYADQVKTDVIGTASDTKDSDTVKGAKALANEKVAGVTAGNDGIKVDNTDATNPKVELQLSPETDNELEIHTAEGKKGLYYKAPAAVDYEIVKQDTAEDGFASTYILSKGGAQAGAKINIPKDIFVQDISGVLTADAAIEGTDIKKGDKYVVFTVDTSAAGTKKLYLKLTDLVDTYGADGKAIVMSADNIFSLQIDAANANGLAVGDDGLKMGVATDTAAGAMSAADHVKLTTAYDAITVGSF